MRKTKYVTIKSEGRDNGKLFLITEMPAFQAERWARRVLMGMGKSGFDIPDDIMEMGFMAVSAFGIKLIMSCDDATMDDLMIEMMQCVQVVPDPQNREITVGLYDHDIEEVATILTLRSEVLEVHTGFSMAAEMSRILAAQNMKTGTLQNTQTYQSV